MIVSPAKVERQVYPGIALIFLIAILFSCIGPQEPKTILNKEQMTHYLVELYIKEARISNLQLSDDSSKQLMEYFKEKFTESEGIEDSVLHYSANYYLSRPKEMEQVIDAVIDTLSLREQKARIFQ